MSTKYKFVIASLFIALLAAGCGSTNNVVPVSPAEPQAQNSVPSTSSSPPAVVAVPNNSAPAPAIPSKNTVVCPATEHSCPCATGNYCVFRGAMCLNPASACPVKTPTPAPTTVPAPVQPSSANITISNFVFSPASITIKKGTKVTWTNQDSMVHTVTGDNGGPASGDIANGQSYSYTFSQAGTFSYHCSIHPSMAASITVTR